MVDFWAARALLALLLHQFFETRHVEPQAALSAEQFGEVDRKAEGVVELERDIAGDSCCFGTCCHLREVFGKDLLGVKLEIVSYSRHSKMPADFGCRMKLELL